MGCFFKRNEATGVIEEVFAPNGKASWLYEQIKMYLPEDYEPDAWVQTAYRKGYIRSLTDPAEVALALWSRVHTPGDGLYTLSRDPELAYVLKDSNGEPLLPVVREGLQLLPLQIDKKIGAEALIRFLRQEKVIVKKGDRYVVSPEPTLSYKSTKPRAFNARRIQAMMEHFGLSPSAVHMRKEGKDTVVTFDEQQLRVSPGMVAPGAPAEGRTHTKSLVRFLKQRFPQLDITFVSEEKALALYRELQNMQPDSRRNNIDFVRVKSFVYQGKVHLIEGRVDNEVVIEEVLHPFVYTVMQQNPSLFNQLVTAAEKEFPELYKSIQENYPDKAGFIEDDRKQELVAQTLSKLFSKEYAENPPESIRSVMEKFRQWFAKLVKEFGAFIGGKGQVVINVNQLPEGIGLTDIARMLNTYDSQFLVDTTSPQINFRLDAEKEAFIRVAKSKANKLQQKIIDAIMHPPNPVVLDKDTHTYTDMKRDIYTSMTTAINGQFNDPDGKYELNRLWGNAFDYIMESLVMDVDFDTVMKNVRDMKKDDMVVLHEDMARDAYRNIQAYIQGLKKDGSVVLSQVAVSDPMKKIAGTIDLLLIDPEGGLTVIDLKTSRWSFRSPAYDYVTNKAGEGSWLEGESLSKAQKHAIQIGGYKRMLEIAGFRVDSTMTYHIKLEVKGKEHDQKLEGYHLEGWRYHDPMENESLVKRIIPTEPKIDRLQEIREELGLDNPAHDAKAAKSKRWRSKEFRDMLEELKVKMQDFQGKMGKRIDRMEQVKSIATFDPAKEAKQKLGELLVFIGDDMHKGRADLAYGRFLNHAREELQGLIGFLSDPQMKGKDEYIERVFDAHTYIETYRGMVNAPKWALGDYQQEKMLGKVQDLLDVTQKKIKTALEDYILHMMQHNSNRDISEEEWRKIIREGVNISKGDKHLGDIDTSTDPLVAVAAKVYKLAKLRAMEESKSFKGQLHALGNRLVEAFGGKPDFDMILEYDEKGVFTGRYIRPIGPKYYALKKQHEAKLFDEKKNRLKYRPVYGTLGVKDEDIAHNKMVYERRKAWRAFTEAEVITEEGEVKHGMFHRYSQEFIDERSKYEYLKDGRWVMRADVSPEDYKLFEHKYYQFVDGYDKPLIVDGEFTGTLIPKGGRARFVKDQYVETREIAGDNTDMRSEKYRKLMDGTDPKTAAMREFYEFYIKHMETALDKLPVTIQREMIGKIGRVRGKFIDRAMRSPEFFKAATKSVTDWFNVRTSTRQSMYDEEGNLVNQIPVFYTGSLRDEQYIQKLENELKQLEQDLADKKIAREDYVKQHDQLKERLQIAENAVAHDEIETDLVKNLEKFYEMAASFGEMQRIESSLLAVQQVLEERQYTELTASGKELTDKEGKVVRKKGEDSRTLERFQAWMQMTFYSSEDLDRNTWEVVMKRLMNTSSALNVGFNGFGAIHNYAMARINTAIEAWGGLFYSKEAAKRALLSFNEDFLPGWVSTIGSKEGHYGGKRLGSKYEALVKHFDMIRAQRLGEGKPKESILDFVTYGYKLQSAGEFAAQSKTGIAVLMDMKLKHKDRPNEEVSVYDAYEFDEDSQTLKLKEGYEQTSEERHKITNKIWEINKQIHGNYSWEDRAMIQQSILGQMAMQFHKWVYPMYKARFQRAYFDENLGHMEGRYRTVLAFIKLYKEAEGEFWDKVRNAWKDMRPDQVKNVYRNLAELSFFALCVAAYGIFDGLANHVDDDDKYLKRLVNFASWESSRQWKEILFWYPVAGAKQQFEMVKNPFASGTTLTQFSDVLWQLAKWPIPPYDDAYYERGPFKGDLKVWKEFKDVVPLMKEINRWTTFDNVTSFHIK
jgi:hypothetical protein